MEDYTKYPRYYYKFLKLDFNFIQNLINKELWFSDPLNFNDPYDCRLTVNMDNSFYEMLEYLTEVNERTKALSQSEVYKRAQFLYNNPEETKILIDNEVVKVVENFKITCLSKTKKSILMWSHYADSHSGVCLKLDRKMDIDFFNSLLKVKYNRVYPTFNYIIDRKKEKESTIRHITGNKFSPWRYEQEFRILKNKNKTNFRNDGLLSFNENMLVEINFGINCPNCKIELIKNIVGKHYPNKIKLIRAKPIENSFELKFEKL